MTNTITLPRAVVQGVLEALSGKIIVYSKEWREQRKSAITALSEALEQPQQEQRWAVFCAGCRKEWSVPYPHPGKSVCQKCEAKLLKQPQQEPNEADELIRNLGFDPEQFRTDGGYINHMKLRAAIKHPDDYPRIDRCDHQFSFSAELGGQFCKLCGSPERTGAQKPQQDNGGKTGWPLGLLQDDDRKLSKWLASKPDARQRVREALEQPQQVEWVETEGGTRGMRLRDILNPRHPAMAGTVQWHTNKPITDNPVFEVRQL